MNMMRLAALAFSLLPLCGYSYDDDLEAPDVTLYVEAHGVRSDFSEFDGDNANGLRLRFGMLFNEPAFSRWHWGVEGGINQFGESNNISSVTEPGQGFPVISQTTKRDKETRLNGFEFGARLYDGEMFYLRGGAFIYSLKEKSELTVTQLLSDTSTTTFSLTPEAETISSVAPYVGAGIIYPVIDKSASILLEYNYYYVDNKPLDNLAVGIEFRF
ncbi:MAG: hypothetical protein KBT87_06620 [Gammaproteobacteria bacterium]|nr:hypothetical protein [Gammaproteobacteria bacterium]MBQ0774325.1 hypothetical protein [Gammaproteobacteria bacterium]